MWSIMFSAGHILMLYLSLLGALQLDRVQVKGAPILLPTILQPTPLRSLSFDFTLTALNCTLPNANATGAPLVLGQNGVTGGASLHVTSTYASYPYNEFPKLSLIDGQLRAFTSSGEWITNATTTLSGRPMGWLTSRLYHTSPTDYSVIPISNGVRPINLLAVNGRWDLWSLCPFSGFRGQTNVVFNVTGAPPNSGFNPEECYGVWVNALPYEPEPGTTDIDEEED